MRIIAQKPSIQSTHVFCRGVAHSFVRTEDTPILDANGDIVLRLRCLHCGSGKHLIFDPYSGALVRSPIDYADGYLLTGVVKATGSRPSKVAFRSLLGAQLLKETGRRPRRRLRMAS